MAKQTGPAKQTPETARLANRIRRRRAKGEKWIKIAQAEKILKENGEPDPGLASLIAYKNYEPKGQALRERLGLKKFCFECMRGIRKIASGARSLSPWRVWWRRLEPGDRDRWIRENYEKENE